MAKNEKNIRVTLGTYGINPETVPTVAHGAIREREYGAGIFADKLYGADGKIHVLSLPIAKVKPENAAHLPESGARVIRSAEKYIAGNAVAKLLNSLARVSVLANMLDTGDNSPAPALELPN
jgi:hypothetical protein